MKTIYKGDARYEKIKEQMDLLSITDVTTERQVLNGTIVWRLPFKSRGKYVEFGAFASGYVRNQGNQCHSNWQINKRYLGEPEYFKDYEWLKDKQGNYIKQVETGKYVMFQTKKCARIPIEIDRLEYMMKYIIKNEFIKKGHLGHEAFQYGTVNNKIQQLKYDVEKWRLKARDFELKLETINRISNI